MTLTTIRMGKHCGAQVNACANERNASKLAISQREQPSVYDEVINVSANVIVEKSTCMYRAWCMHVLFGVQGCTEMR